MTSRRDFFRTCGKVTLSATAAIEGRTLWARKQPQPVTTGSHHSVQPRLKTVIEAGMDNLMKWSQWMARANPEEVVRKGHPGIRDNNVRHNVGRAIDALLFGSAVTKKLIPNGVLETLRRYLFASLDNPLHLNGSFAIPDRRLRFHAHDVREAILSLTSLIQYRNDQDARKRARLVLDRIQRLTLWDGTFNAKEVAKFPLLADARFTEQMRSPDEKIYTDRNLFNIACWTRGRWIMALCKYYRVTQDAKALELAKRFVRLVRRISFTEDGKIHPTEFDHTHSITGTVHGLIDYGLLVDDEEIVKHGRRIFDVGLASVSSSYGWSVESAWGERQRPNRGEVNNTGDMIQAALLLGRSGLPEYFQDAERRIRGYLLPSQITDGGWGFPGPNDRNGGAGAGSVLDITAGAVQALCETSLTLITRDSSGTRVNLPFTSWLGPTYVTSGLPRKWHIEVTPGQQGSLLARIPSWAPRGNLQVTMAGQPTTPQLHGSWLALMNVPAGTPITVSLPLVEQTVKETVNHQPYQLIYQGDQLVALSPKGPSMPLFPSVEEYQGSKR